MKNKTDRPAAPFYVPPDEIFRESTIERPARAKADERMQLRRQPPDPHDKRPQVSSCSMPQRLRARQAEPRTAADCHARISRRPQGEIC